MTMPNERTRALRFAGEVLQEMLKRPDVPEDLKFQARVTLRHYPRPQDLECMVQDVDQLTRSWEGVHWLAPEDSQ
jgi:hypothetical protein